MLAATSLSHEEPSPQRQLIDRLRFILAVIASMASLFVVDELVTLDHSLGVFFASRIIGVVLALVGFVVLRQRWAESWAWPLTIAIISFAYLFVATAGLASPEGEYVTAAMLFVGAALLTATVLPWGVGPQCATVAVGATALAMVILWTDGTLAVLMTDPAAVVIMGFVLSTVIAREFERHRTARRRDRRAPARERSSACQRAAAR